MHDENIPDDLPPLPHTGRGGPRTTAGKAISCQNALKHGCRSEKILLAGEDPAEFESTVDAWFDHYHPATEPAIALVEQLARSHWKLKRNQKRLEEIEYELPANPSDWTAVHHQQFTLFTRYLTTAERSFFRSYKEIEAHYHRIHRDEIARSLALAQITRMEFKRLDKVDEAALKQLRFDQIVEVEQADGIVTTSLLPSNEELLELGSKRAAPPAYVARWLMFTGGIVPDEYAWTRAVTPKNGAYPQAAQRMPWRLWLEQIEHEASTGSGRIGPLLALQPFT